jgi:hypothetical protein
MLLRCSIAFDVGGSSPKKIGRKKTDAEESQEEAPSAKTRECDMGLRHRN